MTSKSVILLGLALCVYEITVLWVTTDPGNGWNATSMTLGTDADSDVLILTPNSTETLAPSNPFLPTEPRTGKNEAGRIPEHAQKDSGK